MPFSHTRVVNTEPYVKGFICGEKYSRRRGEISSTRKIVGLQYGHHQNLPPPPPLSSPSPIIMLPKIILPPHRILTLYFSVGHCRLLGNNEYFFSLKYQVIRVWIILIELLGNLMKLNLGLIFFLKKKNNSPEMREKIAILESVHLQGFGHLQFLFCDLNSLWILFIQEISASKMKRFKLKKEWDLKTEIINYLFELKF